MTAPTNHLPPSYEVDEPRRWWVRILIIILGVGMLAMWTWALFFASREGVNRIEDREWVEASEQICQATAEEREQLADFTDIREATPDMIYHRADLIEQATDQLTVMIDQIDALPLTGDKGLAIVPDWIADYRQYIVDRHHHVDELRATGENLRFFETGTDEGIPLSEKIATFATDNAMPTCAPPLDLN